MSPSDCSEADRGINLSLSAPENNKLTDKNREEKN
jgi:hypothetical protein